MVVTKNRLKIKMKNFVTAITVFLFSVLLLVSSCQNKSTDEISLREKELELKEKELAIKEREALEQKQKELEEKVKELESSREVQPPIRKEISGVNLNGTYSGSIKDGTLWYVYIRNFDGTNFTGSNNIYWPKSPNGYKTNFTGTYNSNTGEIIMYEDRNAKGAGKFIGKVFDNGGSMSGTWYRYSDGGSFTWNLGR